MRCLILTPWAEQRLWRVYLLFILKIEKTDMTYNLNVSNDILEIKQTCISSKAFQLSGSKLKSEEKESEAKQLMFMLGNQLGQVFEDFLPMPEDLKHFTLLQNSWDQGIENALESIEISSCSQCQNSEVAMCSYHDC